MLSPTVKNIENIAKRPDRLLAIKENATITEAAKKMSDNHIGSLVVFDENDKFAGVITEHDMLAKVLTKSLSPDDVIVTDVMTTDAISCTLETVISDVEQLMAMHKIRHIPIIDNGVPIGMVSSRDVIAYQLTSNEAMKTAAEQLAMLTTQLKSLDFDDVIELAINQVPKSFHADWAVLCIKQNEPTNPMVHRKACPLSENYLLQPDGPAQFQKNDQVSYGKICEHCANIDSRPPAILIPISIHDQSADRLNRNLTSTGFLCMCRLETSSLSSQELQLYKASLLSEVLSAGLTNAKLYQNYQQARRDSQTDPLTGVGTRRVLDKVLAAEYARAARYNRPFSVAIVDIDNFKQINDQTGHAAGDKALKNLAKIMTNTIRSADIVTRYGGDEFVLLMPETEMHDAARILERIRRRVGTISVPKFHTLSISCGLAQWNGSIDDTPQSILKRADAALYQAKSDGRNKVVKSDPPKNKT